MASNRSLLARVMEAVMRMIRALFRLPVNAAATVGGWFRGESAQEDVAQQLAGQQGQAMKFAKQFSNDVDLDHDVAGGRKPSSKPLDEREPVFAKESLSAPGLSAADRALRAMHEYLPGPPTGTCQ